MNQSTKPNGITKIVCVDGVPHLCVFALRDIKDGEQILYHSLSCELTLLCLVMCVLLEIHTGLWAQ